MLSLPRVAVGTIQADADPRPALCAFIEFLREHDLQVQSFLSRACFNAYRSMAAASGSSPRHLDSWLMSADLCREIFIHGSETCDLAIVEGCFQTVEEGNGEIGGRLEPLCDWLDLPKLAVVDASTLDGRIADNLAGRADGLLIDMAGGQGDSERTAEEFETRYGVPVLGTLKRTAGSREGLPGEPDDCHLPELSRRSQSRFVARWSPERILQLASRRAVADVPLAKFRDEYSTADVTIALAYDDAFNCYFPDTLDLLESRGATLLDFSPLGDEELPEDVDIVYIGCGHPERHADELVHNHCMIHSLRQHLRGGGRIYAEGGGLAYLCQEMEAADGHNHRMAGVFPAVALCNEKLGPAKPVELTVDRPTWLAAEGTGLRGYRNPLWHLQPTGYLTSCVEGSENPYDMVGNFRAIGSLLHIDFAANEELSSRFFDPNSCDSDSTDPWTMMT